MDLIKQEQNQYEEDVLESKFKELKTKAMEKGFNNLEINLMHFMFYNKANHGLTARTFHSYLPKVILENILFENTMNTELNTIYKLNETYNTLFNREQQIVKEIASIAGINEKRYNSIYEFVSENETTL